MRPQTQRVREALAAVRDIPDDEDAAIVITEILDLLKEANGDLAKERRRRLQGMVDAGRTYRDIGAAVGIGFTRVGQIIRGEATGVTSRARAQREAEAKD